jgi:predicted nucleic acid-binding protein
LKALIDTSVLVAGMLANHPHYNRALPILSSVLGGKIAAVVSAHSIAETYSVLTRMPPPLRISPTRARIAPEANVFSSMTVHALTAGDYRNLIEHLEFHKLTGGITFDAVIAWVAIQTQVDQIITLNVRDFRRIAPALTAKVVTP